jgi:hypothetical protein
LSRPQFEDGDIPSLKICWHIAIGLAQVKMNWVYDWSELKERFEARDRALGDANQSDLTDDNGEQEEVDEPS